MARPINYQSIEILLAEVFREAEGHFALLNPPEVSSEIANAAKLVMESKTAAYREALVTCALVKLLDPQADLSLPYVNHGDAAYNGREIAHKYVVPFFDENKIPSSRGAFLGVFRRSVKFKADTGRGLKDKRGYSAFLLFLEALQVSSLSTARTLFLYLLYLFVEMRAKSNIPISRIQRLGLDQYELVIVNLLRTPSGGLIPVLLAVAMFKTISDCFTLQWDIDWQGINVADSASNVGGDITVKSDGRILLVIEVTERTIDKARIRSTFNTKGTQSRNQ